jgi:DNA polymerase III subunit gamma/tau
MTLDLARKYRPKRFDDVVGQPEAVSVLKGLLAKKQLPHAILLVSPSGTGKTSIARILRDELECTPDDYKEINCATNASIDMIRDIEDKCRYSPMFGGKTRIYYLDEAGSLSRTPFCQQAMLKVLEDPPDHCYFILAAMDVGKIIDGIKTRCLRVNLNPIGKENLGQLVRSVWTKECPKEAKPDSVVNSIVSSSKGSARSALLLLQKVINLKTEEEQLAAINNEDEQKNAFELVKLLMWGDRKWKDVQKLLNSLQDMELEPFRQSILTCCRKELAKDKGQWDKAYNIISAFESPFFDTGEAGLWRACYECSRK